MACCTALSAKHITKHHILDVSDSLLQGILAAQDWLTAPPKCVSKPLGLCFGICSVAKPLPVAAQAVLLLALPAW